MEMTSSKYKTPWKLKAQFEAGLKVSEKFFDQCDKMNVHVVGIMQQPSKGMRLRKVFKNLTFKGKRTNIIIEKCDRKIDINDLDM